MLTYRGFEITFEEAPKFVENGRQIDGAGRLIYRASCDLGVAYALQPGIAQADLHRIIDGFLNSCRQYNQ